MPNRVNESYVKMTRLPDDVLKTKLDGLLFKDATNSNRLSTFADGTEWKIEIPSVNSIKYLSSIFESSDRLGVKVHRITETLGLMLHSRSDIKDYVRICEDRSCQLLMSIGPRAPYDIGRSAHTDHGKFAGYRIRGLCQLQYALGEIIDAIGFGVKGFVIYDEGLLDIVSALREEGEIPSDIHFKASAHMGHGNPASVRLLERLGANSINPIRDLPITHLKYLRSAVSVPLDIHVDNPMSSGGSIRYYDAPTLVRELAPIHLKIGNSVLARHGNIGSEEEATECARRCRIVQEIMQEGGAESTSP